MASEAGKTGMDRDDGASPDPGPYAATSAALVTPLPLRRNPGFRMLWIGQALSDTGSNAAFIAYPLLILALTGSPAIAGVVGTVRLVVELVLGLPGGTLSDRLDRRLTMIACDGARVVVMALLAVLVLVHLVSWPVVLIVAVVDGAANVVFNPAAAAALPAIVADEQLEQAWAATEARTYAANLAGPALGGALFGLARALPFIGDSVSYLISVATLSRIRGRFRPENARERASLWRETADGVRTVWQHPLLRAVVIQAPLINFAFNGVIFAITVALRKYGIAPGVVGLVQAGIAAGGLLGALIATPLQGRLPLSQVVVVLTVMATALFAAGAAILPSTFVAVPVAVALMLGPTANAALFAAMLRAAPEGIRGRVNNTVLLAATALAALSPLVAGLVVEHLSGRWALLAFAAVMAVSAVLSIVLPGLRTAEAAGALEATNTPASDVASG